MTPDDLRQTLDAHATWLRGRGGKRAYLSGADLSRAYLSGADLSRADLSGADLSGADLSRAYLSGAYLSGAYLSGAYLSGADLSGADLSGAVLSGAVLSRADLSGADLSGADLSGADLSGATLPDGRTLEAWQAAPLAGLCDDPDAVARAMAAWGAHTWQDCPLHAAHGWSGFTDALEEKRLLAAAFVALFDGGHLPKPTQDKKP